MGERLRFIEEEKSKKKPFLLQLLLIGGLLVGLSQVRDGEKDAYAGAIRSEKENSYRPPSLPPLGSPEDGGEKLFSLADITSWSQKSSHESADEAKDDENSPAEKLKRFFPYLENQVHLSADKMEELKKNILDLMEDIPFLSAPDASRIIIKEWIEEEKAREKMQKEKKAKHAAHSKKKIDEEENDGEEEIFDQEETYREGTLPLPEIRLPGGAPLFVVDIGVSSEGQLRYTIIDPKDVFKTKQFDRSSFIQAMKEILENGDDIEKVFVLKAKEELSSAEQEKLNVLINRLQDKFTLMEFTNE